MPGEGEIPNACHQQMVVLTCTDGVSNYVVDPYHLSQFVHLHSDCVWVAHNARFDYWVVREQLERSGTPRTVGEWDLLPEQGRLRDTMLLEFLYKLATTKKPEVLRMKGLDDLAREIGIHVDKKQVWEGKDVRTGFGAFLGLPVSSIPARYLDYAVLDTVATLAVFTELDWKVRHICKKNEHGYLTDALQVRADIALGAIGKRGVWLDQDHIPKVAERMWQEIQNTIQFFKAHYPLVFDYYKKTGEVKLKPKTGLPGLKRNGVDTYLLRAVEEWKIPPENLHYTPKPGKDGKPRLAQALDPWLEWAKGHPFVSRWAAYQQTIKQNQFVRKLIGQEAMYADYRVCMVTGRTSCTGEGGGVNIQQWPRATEMRNMFIARPGHTLIICDYSAIELVTLAAVLMDRYGKSQLAEVLKKGVDPHAYTAAMFTGVDPQEFLEWKTTRPDVFKRDRQNAKPINFGVPGGLGPRRLAGYASLEYGVDMSVDRAKELRKKLITEVYPELEQYLKSYEHLNIAKNLCVPWEQVILAFDPNYEGFWYSVQRIVGLMDGLTMAGKPYNKHTVKKVWDALEELDQGKIPELSRLIASRKGSGALRRYLFGEQVTTLTGRIREGADYGEARNTPFQGLAADGAKIALWNLHKLGFQTVAFIHDEVVVEVEEGRVDSGVLSVERVMIESMQSVVGHGLPIKVETKVSTKWTK